MRRFRSAALAVSALAVPLLSGVALSSAAHAADASDPAVPGASAKFHAVSASSPTDAWAVGYYVSKSVRYTLILHWDGTAWSMR